MAVVKFEEVLNDLVNYFILGDPDLLLQYKEEHHLPNDLVTEFTTSEEGDNVVKEGIMVPLPGIENYPYTIYFNLSGETPELMKEGNDLQIKREGYILKVAHESVYLYTIPYLRDYTAEKVRLLKKHRVANIALPNGWYTVTVLGGQTRQSMGLEPTFEFVMTAVQEQPEYTADMNLGFGITSDEY
ncbi:hypothetical protein F0L74_12790 [Chitinophaga agrisoli]|uniref:Uncharacterized protein n=1 Tax=Chitinophaga agrisoli TaxID=2607653 RepID=A0A5B2VYG6_9BACT|nr:hypothetical protein [Chitinophaga agrisoli]KAA2243372.1 hypothetical protein F0L74_12790 [Chitinophaga agrisoli]